MKGEKGWKNAREQGTKGENRFFENRPVQTSRFPVDISGTVVGESPDRQC